MSVLDDAGSGLVDDNEEGVLRKFTMSSPASSGSAHSQGKSMDPATEALAMTSDDRRGPSDFMKELSNVATCQNSMNSEALPRTLPSHSQGKSMEPATETTETSATKSDWRGPSDVMKDHLLAASCQNSMTSEILPHTLPRLQRENSSETGKSEGKMTDRNSFNLEVTSPQAENPMNGELNAMAFEPNQMAFEPNKRSSTGTSGHGLSHKLSLMEHILLDSHRRILTLLLPQVEAVRHLECEVKELRVENRRLQDELREENFRLQERLGHENNNVQQAQRSPAGRHGTDGGFDCRDTRRSVPSDAQPSRRSMVGAAAGGMSWDMSKIEGEKRSWWDKGMDLLGSKSRRRSSRKSKNSVDFSCLSHSQRHSLGDEFNHQMSRANMRSAESLASEVISGSARSSTQLDANQVSNHTHEQGMSHETSQKSNKSTRFSDAPIPIATKSQSLTSFLGKSVSQRDPADESWQETVRGGKLSDVTEVDKESGPSTPHATPHGTPHTSMVRNTLNVQMGLTGLTTPRVSAISPLPSDNLASSRELQKGSSRASTHTFGGPVFKEVTWQWLHRTGYRDYDPKSSNKIECAYRAGETKFRLKSGKSGSKPIEIFFEDMIQYDPFTGNTREIRRMGYHGLMLHIRRFVLGHWNRWKTGGPRREKFDEYQRRKDELTMGLDPANDEVTDFYHAEGRCATIARNHWFIGMHLVMILISLLWVAIDIDCNNTVTTTETHALFQLMENWFCIYFTLQVLVRFLATELKRNCFKDIYFITDAVLIVVMIPEILLRIVQNDNLQDSALGRSMVLRILRLFRLVRVVHLIRVASEMFTLLKSIKTAMRSVAATLLAMFIFLYIFGCIFTSLSQYENELLFESYFASVGDSMLSLFCMGTLLDGTNILARDLKRNAGLPLLFLFLLFTFLSSFFLLSLIIGVLCQVVAQVSDADRAAAEVAYLKSHLLGILECYDEDGNNSIDRDAFDCLMESPELHECLIKFGADVNGLISLGDVLFLADAPKDGSSNGNAEEKQLTFKQFLEVVLRLRGEKNASVTDVVELREFVRQRQDHLEAMLLSMGCRLHKKGRKSLGASSGYSTTSPKHFNGELTGTKSMTLPQLAAGLQGAGSHVIDGGKNGVQDEHAIIYPPQFVKKEHNT